jgi:hypothetical protein
VYAQPAPVFVPYGHRHRHHHRDWD